MEKIKFFHRLKANNMPENIIITGASSGIGKAIALQYAQQGVTLGLIARNKERLERTAKQCIEKGASVKILISDVSDHENISQWLKEFDSSHPVDLVFSNAGISGGTGETGLLESTDNIERIFKTNVIDAIFVGQCLYEEMQKRQKGHIVFTGSIAGFQGWAGAPAYTSSKSALHTYAESLRMLVAKDGIKVSIIAPGFVKSAMTDQNEFPMPFKVGADKAAIIIQKGVQKNRKYIIFPLQMYFISIISRLLPESFLIYLSKKIKGKK